MGLTRIFFIFITCAFFIWLLSLLAPVLTPFLISALLAYLGNPTVDGLQKLYPSRIICVCIVFLLMLLIIGSILIIMIPLLGQQIRDFLVRLPEIINWLEVKILPVLSNLLNIDLTTTNLSALKEPLFEHWQTVGRLATGIWSSISDSWQILMHWLLHLMLIPVVTFYLLCDWKKILHRSATLVPRKYIKTTTKILLECNMVIAEFFRGQLWIILGQGLIYSLGLWIVGLEFALLIGMLAGLLSFVPYLGVIIGVLVAGTVAFIQFQAIMPIIHILIVFAIGQLIEGSILSPWLVGDRIGLHPVAVIFAIMAGGELFGFFGVLIALPTAAIIIVLLKHSYHLYIDSEFYQQ